MKKKILGLFGAIAIIALMVFNTQFSNNANDDNIALSSIVKLTNANAEYPDPDPIGHIGDGWCTCKNGVCQDGNWIGFRKICGQGDSDEHCALFNYGNC